MVDLKCPEIGNWEGQWGVNLSLDSSLSLPPTLLLDKFTVLLKPELNCVFSHRNGVYVCLRKVGNSWKNFRLQSRFCDVK